MLDKANAQMNLEVFLNATSEAFIEFQLFVARGNYSSILETVTDSMKNAAFLVNENLVTPITFTELQATLLTVFLAIILINLLLIGFYWNKYGGVITDRFIRPSTSNKPFWGTGNISISILNLHFFSFSTDCRHIKRNRRIKIIGG